jgi:hypothetical protein
LDSTIELTRGAPARDSRWRFVLRRGVALAESRPNFAWFAYGGLWCVIGVLYLNGHLHGTWTFISSRQQALVQTIAAHDAGHGPLVAQVGRHAYLPSYPGDDQGLYYFPVLLHDVFPHASADALVARMFIGLMCLVVLVYPLLYRRLLDSRIAALAAAPLVLFSLSFMAKQDVYWEPGWATALALPCILLAWRRRWSRGSLALLAAAMLVASFSDAWRSFSGVIFLVIALAILAWREPRWWARLGGAVVLLMVYLSIGSGLFAIARAERAHNMRGIPVAANREGLRTFNVKLASMVNGVWHTAYIGLGYVPNRYGIQFQDESGFSYVKRIDPRAKLYSSRYEAILRKRYLHIVTTDPSFALGVYSLKFGTLLKDGFSRFPLLLVLLPVMPMLGPLRKRMRAFLVIAGLVSIWLMATPLLSVPQTYETGWLGALGTVAVLGYCWLLVGAAHLAQNFVLEPPVPGVLRRARTWKVIAAVAGSVIGFSLIKSAGPYYTPVQPGDTPPRHPVVNFDFAPGQLGAWRPAVPGVLTLGSPPGLEVWTTSQEDAYQLKSPVIRLRPGSYDAVALGEVMAGRLGFGVLDQQRDTWLDEGQFENLGFRGAVGMPLSFTLSAPADVRLIFMNVLPHPGKSRWIIRDVWIRRRSP